MSENNLSRRDFLKRTAAAAITHFPGINRLPHNSPERSLPKPEEEPFVDFELMYAEVFFEINKAITDFNSGNTETLFIYLNKESQSDWEFPSSMNFQFRFMVQLPDEEASSDEGFLIDFDRFIDVKWSQEGREISDSVAYLGGETDQDLIITTFEEFINILPNVQSVEFSCYQTEELDDNILDTFTQFQPELEVILRQETGDSSLIQPFSSEMVSPETSARLENLNETWEKKQFTSKVPQLEYTVRIDGEDVSVTYKIDEQAKTLASIPGQHDTVTNIDDVMIVSDRVGLEITFSLDGHNSEQIWDMNSVFVIPLPALGSHGEPDSGSTRNVAITSHDDLIKNTVLSLQEVLFK